MAKVLGVGGIFFKSPDAKRLGEWYSRWLGMAVEGRDVMFSPDAMPKGGGTVWSVFPAETDYFSPSTQPFMINLVVDDLDAVLQQVEQGGAQVVGEIEAHRNGRFGWFIDPDNNKVELWEPLQVK